MLEGKDFLLLVVAAGENKPLTPVQLQKTLFLINEAKLLEADESLYNFKPYHYGPFDAQVYNDADILGNEGLVYRLASEEGGWTNTVISPAGLDKAKKIREELPGPWVQYIHELVGWAQKLTFRELVSVIYKMYPQYRENSVFQG